MNISLKRQAAAIRKAIKTREALFAQAWKHDLEGFRQRDKQWSGLNAAYSTLIALSLNETVTKNFEKPIGKPKVKR